MSFLWPVMFLTLLLIPLLAWQYIRLQRRREQLRASYGSLGMLQGALGRGPGGRRHVPPALFLGGLAILLAGVARPQAEVSLPRAEGTVILAFDVSGSMAAEDLQPTRMEAAKAAAREFVERQPLSIQIGVVAFSDSGFQVQIPTDDRQAILAAIERLVPQRGTSLGQGMIASLNTLALDEGQSPRLYSNLEATPVPMPAGSDTSAAVVLLTDGENNVSPDPLEVAQAAAERGVRIYTVGIGSAAGTTLEVEGFTVHTQLNEEMLQQIAQITEAAYYNAENQQDLEAIYGDLDLQFVVRPEKTEVTALFAGLGSLLLLAGALCSLLWFGRVP